ncbi:MAG: lipocalin-like domain-containing protein [Polymorphobacter sp.]
MTIPKSAFALASAFVLAAAVPAMATTPPTPKAAAAAKALTGTWQLVRYENTMPDGKVVMPFGAKPKGYFTYDPTGHLSIHIMRTPPVVPFAAGNAKGTDAEVRNAYESYAGYFGTWRINDDATAVVHIVEGALRPDYTGTDQFRPFTLNGDTLIVRPSPSEYRELRRVR